MSEQDSQSEASKGEPDIPVNKLHFSFFSRLKKTTIRDGSPASPGQWLNIDPTNQEVTV